MPIESNCEIHKTLCEKDASITQDAVLHIYKIYQLDNEEQIINLIKNNPMVMRAHVSNCQHFHVDYSLGFPAMMDYSKYDKEFPGHVFKNYSDDFIFAEIEIFDASAQVFFENAGYKIINSYWEVNSWVKV